MPEILLRVHTRHTNDGSWRSHNPDIRMPDSVTVIRDVTSSGVQITAVVVQHGGSVATLTEEQFGAFYLPDLFITHGTFPDLNPHAALWWDGGWQLRIDGDSLDTTYRIDGYPEDSAQLLAPRVAEVLRHRDLIAVRVGLSDELLIVGGGRVITIVMPDIHH